MGEICSGIIGTNGLQLLKSNIKIFTEDCADIIYDMRNRQLIHLEANSQLRRKSEKAALLCFHFKMI